MANNWTQVSPLVSPDPREAHSMALDTARGVIVMYGGDDGSTPFAETWEFDLGGNTWTLITTAHDPPFAGPMTFDANRGTITMLIPGPTLALWEYDGVDWTDITPGTMPTPGRTVAGFVHYPTFGKSIMWGGKQIAGGCLQDTWGYDGSTFAAITTATSPPACDQFALVYDATRDKVLQIAGRCTVTTYRNQTYEFDGSDWAQIVPSASPVGIRSGCAYGYAASCAGTVVFSGDSGLGQTKYLDTGTDWVDESPVLAPSARFNYPGYPFMCEDPDGGLVLFGGQAIVGGPVVVLGDTWRWFCGDPPPVVASLRHTFGLG